MRIAGITYDSFVDGPGLRVVVFAQGCDIGCENCHNPDSWDTSTGKEYTPQQLTRLIKKPRPGREMVRGVTFSGGEPFLQASELAKVASALKKFGWDVVTYTGHTFEQLVARDDAGVDALIANTDYLIDGPYVQNQRNLDLKFRGSGNQRIIDMQKTRATGGVVVTAFED